MERCDFSSVITTIRKFISEDHNLSQIDLLYELFDCFLKDESSLDFDFDNGLVCRWFNGQARISPRISGFYLDMRNRKKLAEDMGSRILPKMYDSSMAVQEVYQILLGDSSVSEKVKSKLFQFYPCDSASEEAAFLSSVLCFAMERTFVKRDAATKKLLSGGTLSPLVTDFIYSESVPKPCRYFCGRESELKVLHELLCENGKVFLQGIPGIGKSELAKAYAKEYDKTYTNILYFIYSGDLKHDIIHMDFADDLPEDSEEERFRKHNRFLRTLKEDTLLIIDNFNATSSQDELLSVVLKYRCRILFTTRCRYDHHTFLNITEISDNDVLLHLMGYFYSDAEKNRSILEQIIKTVHHHTFAVELSARLLQTGFLEPGALLDKLKEEKAAMDATDTIGISKDGKNTKSTYYDHIHTLFALYRLSFMETDVMRNLTLVPASGISSRLFAAWLHQPDLNVINDLVEKGFVQSRESHCIALHPMIQDVVIEETKPSIQKCFKLLDSIRNICLRHGEDVTYYRQLFLMIESIIHRIDNDDMPFYLRFLEDVFPYMEKYHHDSGMDTVLNVLDLLLKDNSDDMFTDRALLLSFRSAREKNTEKAIRLLKEAISIIPEVNPLNALLVSNLFANLGGLYKEQGKHSLAKENMERGIRLLEQYNLTHYHDSIPQVVNFAVLLAETGQPKQGLTSLQKLSSVLEECRMTDTMDYAMIQEAMGTISLILGEVSRATGYFKTALGIHEMVFRDEPEIIEAKKLEIQKIYIQVGVYLGKQINDAVFKCS